MKKISLALAVCAAALVVSAALTGCAGKKSEDAAKAHEPKPVESLLTTEDMHACEQQQGIAQPKTATDFYGMSEGSIEKAKGCAFEQEKLRMPLLADLIDKYKGMLQDGNKECLKDIGTHYAASCLKESTDGAAEWYNLAVSQRLLMSGMPSKPQTPPKPAP